MPSPRREREWGPGAPQPEIWPRLASREWPGWHASVDRGGLGGARASVCQKPATEVCGRQPLRTHKARGFPLAT